MCVSLRPAHFSKTKGLAAEARRGRKIVHLLGYGNTVANLASDADFGWSRGDKPSGTGNAMLLPIPAKPGTMTEKNVFDTTSAPNFLKDMERAILPPVTRGGGRRGGTLGKGLPDSVRVFEHDIYTVVLASRAQDIPAVLSRVPAAKRPVLNKEIFEAYARWYPGWTFALCCFNTKDEASAKPLLWWYEPQHPEFLFFPALDGHDGKVPNLSAQVTVDHAIMVGSHEATDGEDVRFTDSGMSEELRKLLPTLVVGRQYNERLRNGDFLFRVSDVRAGKFNAKRELPPGAEATPAPEPEGGLRRRAPGGPRRRSR